MSNLKSAGITTILCSLAAGSIYSVYYLIVQMNYANSDYDSTVKLDQAYLSANNCTDINGNDYSSHCGDDNSGRGGVSDTCDEVKYQQGNATLIDEQCITACEELCSIGPAVYVIPIVALSILAAAFSYEGLSRLFNLLKDCFPSGEPGTTEHYANNRNALFNRLPLGQPLITEGKKRDIGMTCPVHNAYGTV